MDNKLCLGTVQLGVKYGINNELNRQPTERESIAVLDAALANGIQYFDTASVYGDAEKILGKYNIGSYRAKVISKLKPGIDVDVVATIQNEVKQSLKRLELNVLDGYLLHDAQDFYCSEIIRGLQICKEKGLVKNIGVSIYDTQDALNVVKSGVMDYIQIPYNVFDQRLNETNFFEIAEQKQVKVFARSSFLQGLLLMDIGQLPNQLMDAKKYLEMFSLVCTEYGFTRIEAAFLFCYCNDCIDKIVFGVETQKQLVMNLEIIKRREEFKDCYQALTKKFIGINNRIIIPSMW